MTDLNEQIEELAKMARKLEHSVRDQFKKVVGENIDEVIIHLSPKHKGKNVFIVYDNELL